jgi:hypothetical protein
LWLGLEAFRQLVERALHEVLPSGTIPPPSAGSAGKGLRQRRRGRFYRPCVVCGELMNRVNYGRVSGVIIDACKEHGIWFDAEGLTRILDWIHKGGAEVTARAEEEDRQELGRESAGFEHPRRPLHFLDALVELLQGPR